ncbi:unnamed protein product [Bursaphelenchus xylophilus]|uniref:(pine wood nematode) hypothetical protein n=1 Tax=Bursaphelenchus xylophilus TaxID=6326 RepID=A0A1I7RK25_BURXY|nr:unnamed protein product [Bursaphelenchus xylophilus]CAG9131557.1 unnamed protein product [Bursaphelenchus xylophilus]
MSLNRLFTVVILQVLATRWIQCARECFVFNDQKYEVAVDIGKDVHAQFEFNFGEAKFVEGDSSVVIMQKYHKNTANYIFKFRLKQSLRIDDKVCHFGNSKLCRLDYDPNQAEKFIFEFKDLETALTEDAVIIDEFAITPLVDTDTCVQKDATHHGLAVVYCRCGDYYPPTHATCPKWDDQDPPSPPPPSPDPDPEPDPEPDHTTATNDQTDGTTGTTPSGPDEDNNSTDTTDKDHAFLINCVDPTTELEKIYCHAKEDVIEKDDVKKVVNRTIHSFDEKTANSSDFYMLSRILERISQVNDIYMDDFEPLYLLFDKSLGIDEATMLQANQVNAKSTTRVIKSIDNVLTKARFDLELDHGHQLAMHRINEVNCNKKIHGMAIYDDKFGWSEDNKNPIAQIELENEVVCHDGSSGGLMFAVEQSSVYFVAYRKNSLFVPTKDVEVATKEDRCRKGMIKRENPVMSAKVVGKTIDDTDIPVATLKYRKDEVNTPLHGSLAVTSFENEDWQRERKCDLKEKDGYYVGECHHLTDFTILVDGCVTDPVLCDPALQSLGLTANIGSTLCLAFLFTVHFLRRFFSRLSFVRSNLSFIRVDSIRLPYYFSYFLFYLSFTSFADQRRTTGEGFCSAIAGFNYCILLVCIMLTITQSWRVLRTCISKPAIQERIREWTRSRVVMPVVLVVCGLIALICSFITPAFYRRHDDFCWINPSFVILAVMVPLSFLILNAIFCLFVVFITLFGNYKFAAHLQRAMKFKEHFSVIDRRNSAKKREIRNKLSVIFALQFMIGLPWICQYFSLFTANTTVWHYLFNISSGCHGIYLMFEFIIKYFDHRYQKKKHENVSATSSNNVTTLTTQIGKSKLHTKLSDNSENSRATVP